MRISERLRAVLDDIADVARSCGRQAEGVCLVAVSKTQTWEAVKEAADAGQLDFGENRVQELVSKHARLPGLRWHMIGTLQRNKVRQIAPFVHLIHSVDSHRLLLEIERQAALADRTIDCLLQINISGEPQKGGLTESECEDLLQNLTEMQRVRIIGVMGMAEDTDEEAKTRSQFRSLRATFDKFSQIVGPNIRMEILSMGMSGDYVIAIQEGATMLRIGSSIFGGRQS